MNSWLNRFEEWERVFLSEPIRKEPENGEEETDNADEAQRG